MGGHDRPTIASERCRFPCKLPRVSHFARLLRLRTPDIACRIVPIEAEDGKGGGNHALPDAGAVIARDARRSYSGRHDASSGSSGSGTGSLFGR